MSEERNALKPLGAKAYGSIGHLPGSRMGPADKTIEPHQAEIATVKVPNRLYRVIVQEKLDGSCVAVARIGDEIVPLMRAGYDAASSRFEQHHLFDAWAKANHDRFREVLKDGERLCGEWLAQAHGTRYELYHEPFVAFDLINGTKGGSTRLTFDAFCDRVAGRFVIPTTIKNGSPLSISDAISALGPHGFHGALDPVEGAVWRVEKGSGPVDHREWKVCFLAKYVRPDKEDGCYLPEISGKPAVWNWHWKDFGAA